MQITQHVSLAFLNDSIPNKLLFGEHVHDTIAPNVALFPNLPHNPAAIATANADLSSKAAVAANGDKADIDTRNVSEAVWNGIMKDNALEVEHVAKGDVTIIDKSGYSYTKGDRTPRTAPVDCQNPQTSVDNLVGGMNLSVNPDTNIDAFLYIARTSGVSVQQMGNQLIFTIGTEKVVIVIDTHRSVTMTGLTSHVPLQVQMMGVNVAGANNLTNTKISSPQ